MGIYSAKEYSIGILTDLPWVANEYMRSLLIGVLRGMGVATVSQFFPTRLLSTVRAGGWQQRPLGRLLNHKQTSICTKKR